MAITLPLLALSFFQTAAAASVDADACATLVPPALAARLNMDLPGYQPAASSDAGEQRVKGIATQGDWPCPFVVVGDFDGNGALDRALLLKPREAGNARLIGALNNNGQWQLTLSEDWPLALSDSELRPKEPGLYQRAAAIQQPVEQFDQLASLQTEDSCFTAGKIAGMHAIYAVINGKWQKLTVQEP